MIRPLFSIQQTDELVVLRIRLPYVKISSAELNVQGNRLLFSLPPYFLDLHLPGQLADEGVRSAVYDHNDSHLTVKVAKLSKGEHFKDLDLMTALMRPSKSPVPKLGPKIEVIAETTAVDELSQAMEGLSLKDSAPSGPFTYGFDNGHSKVFVDLKVLSKGGNIRNRRTEP